MKSTMRGLVFGLAALGALSFVGCNDTTNEKEVLRDTASAGGVKVGDEVPRGDQYNEMLKHTPPNPTAKGYGMQKQGAGGGGAGGRR